MTDDKYKALQAWVLEIFPAYPDCETAIEQCRRGNKLAITVGRIFREELTPELKAAIRRDLINYAGGS